MTVLARLERHARTIGYRAAVRTDHGVWSFEELWDRTERIASALQASGVRRGQTIGLVGDNSDEYLASFLGCLLVRAVVVPVNTRLRPVEVRSQLELAGAAGVIFSDDGYAALREDLQATVPSWSSIELDRTPPDEWDFPQPTDPALCVMTTGTTGAPKGVVHTHGGLEHAATLLADALPIAADEISLAFLPFYASIPEQALPVLLAGGSLRLLRHYSVDAVMAACQSVTSFHAVPTIVGRLLTDGDYDQLRTLRWISFASEPMPLSLLERWWAEIPEVEAHQFYGMSEMLPITYASSSAMHESPGTVGAPFPTSLVQIVDAGLNPLPVGEEGEVVCASPARMQHYLGRPDLTDAALTPDGAMRTGDRGKLDSEGRLHLTGRIKDLIISGGLNISPAEIEAVAAHYPGVDAVAVIGVPSAEWGETPVVIAVPAPGGSLDLLGMLDYCRSELAAFKRPSGAAMIGELPITGIGKTDKTLLRTWLTTGVLEVVRVEAGSSMARSRP